MKINVNEIPKDGLHLQERFEPKILEFDVKDLYFVSAISAIIDAEKISNEVIVNVDLTAEIEATCSRCLGKFRHDLNKKMKFTYEVKDTTVIDITEDIRQELILNYPIKLLCKSDCKGLCSECGQNLNEVDCGHKHKTSFNLRR